MHVPHTSEQPLILWWPDVAPTFGYKDRGAALAAAHRGAIDLHFVRGANGKLFVRTVELRRLLGLDDDAPAAAS